ncbi:UNVERIFIED_ORG: addiction module RelB/DinJ family antitoxin [Shinella zoogloeoides]|nr:addiction module RelB/DinJ family antitoxin [Shinella zoogloeoides]
MRALDHGRDILEFAPFVNRLKNSKWHFLILYDRRPVEDIEGDAQLSYKTVQSWRIEMAANAYVRARIDQALKDDATVVLDSLGLTISDVMRMTLTRIAREKALPVELTRPNAETLVAIEEARAIKAQRRNGFANAEDLVSSIEASESGT